MPETKSTSRINLFGFIPLFTAVDKTVKPDDASRQSNVQRVLAAQNEGDAAPSSDQRRAQQIQHAGAIDDDEEAAVNVVIARQKLAAAESKVEAQDALLEVEWHKDLATILRMERLKRVRDRNRMLPPVNLAKVLRELGDTQEDDRGQQERGNTTTTQRDPQPQGRRYALTINGTAVRQGQTRVNVPNGYVTLDPAPGAQGYDDGTQVSFIASPSTPGSRVTWRGARAEGPFRAIATMTQNRQVQVTITPPAARPTPPVVHEPTPGEAALEEQLQRAGH